MRLSRLRVRNFRNLRAVDLEPPPGVSLVWGDNAQGKTSLLEAIYFLAAGRSFRGRQDRECVRWDAPPEEPALARATVERADGVHEMQAALHGGQKRLSVNGAPLARLAELFGHFNAVLFTPNDLALAQGGPATRRHFLDSEISQVSPTYLAALQRYQQALRQRNALLRSGRGLEALAGSLEAYEQILAETAAEIVAARESALGELNALAGEAYAEFGGGETMTLRYRRFLKLGKAGAAADADGETEAGAERGEAGEDWAELYRARLMADRADDARMGATRSGPHRDDFTIALDGRGAQEFGSQGQQRSCALALRLAEADWMQRRTGEKPVLLLDDLGSELDPGRRKRLLERLAAGGFQAFLTTTQPADFAGAGNDAPFAASYEMRGGEIA